MELFFGGYHHAYSSSMYGISGDNNRLDEIASGSLKVALWQPWRQGSRQEGKKNINNLNRFYHCDTQIK